MTHRRWGTLCLLLLLLPLHYESSQTSSLTSTSLETVKVDAGEGSDEDSPPPTPAPALLSAPQSSKKAAARKRAALRKQGSLGALRGDDATDSDASSVSPAASSIPPLPSIPAAFKLNGNSDLGKKTTKPPAPTKKSSKDSVPTISTKKEELPIPSLPTRAEEPQISVEPEAPIVTESASSSDAETQPGGYSDEEDDEASEDDLDTPSPPPRHVSPPPLSHSPAPASPKPEAYTGADHDPNKKIKAIITRTIFGALMVGSLIGLVGLGHVYVIVLVFFCQAAVYAELTNLFDAGYSSGHGGEENGGEVSQRSKEREERRRGRREERDRWSRRMSWFVLVSFGPVSTDWLKHTSPEGTSSQRRTTSYMVKV